MKLSTGKVAFPIEFDDGKIREIYFNPTDPNLAIRMKNLGNIISKRIEQYSAEIKLTSAGTPEDISQIETFDNMQKILGEELDTAFGGEVYDIVFKDMSPFAIVNGKYFVERFIEEITPEIRDHIIASKKVVSERVLSHTRKYGK